MRALLFGSAAALYLASANGSAASDVEKGICLLYCPAAQECKLEVEMGKCSCTCDALDIDDIKGAASRIVDLKLNLLPGLEFGVRDNAVTMVPAAYSSLLDSSSGVELIFQSDPTGEGGVDVNTATERANRERLKEMDKQTDILSVLIGEKLFGK